MTKSKRKRRIEARNHREGRKVFTVVIVSTLILLILLFIIYSSMG